MTPPFVQSVQVGLPRFHGVAGSAGPLDKPWATAFFKDGVAGPVEVTPAGLVGDGQSDLVNHGGVDKAVLAYSADHYAGWLAELGLAELPGGAFGENLTVAGLAEGDVCVGDVFRCGGVTLEVTQLRQPTGNSPDAGASRICRPASCGVAAAAGTCGSRKSARSRPGMRSRCSPGRTRRGQSIGRTA